MHRSTIHLISTAILATGLSLPVHATTYVIEPDGTGDFPTIQDAIDAASDGDVIELADGIFTGEGNRDIDYGGKAVTVRSQSGNPESCTIDCEADPGHEHRGFYFQSGEGPESVLRGVTLANAHHSESAGGVYCWRASPTFADCVFADNTSWHSGGAIYCAECFSEITGCTFSGNQAWESGGGIYLYESSPTITDCTFSRNESVSYHGGGMGCNSSSPTLTECVFDHNSAHLGGGGIWFYPSCTADLVGCLFFHNWATLGGAVDCFFSCPALTECIFLDNAASYGGGLRCYESSPSLTRCTFSNNLASYGGGVWCEFDSSPELENTIIAFGGGGGALGCDSSVDNLAITCCDFYGNLGGDWVGCVAGLLGVDGNISEDPLFCDPEGGCYRLQDCSPCVEGYGCGQIGACGAGCPCGGGPSEVEATSWGDIKTRFRE